MSSIVGAADGKRRDGQVAITRPAAVGSATATLAARLATLPTASSAQGSTPPRLPRE